MTVAMTESERLLDAATVLDELRSRMVAERRRRGLGLRTAGGQMGYSFAGLRKFEDGRGDVTAHVAVAMLRWLAEDPAS